MDPIPQPGLLSYIPGHPTFWTPLQVLHLGSHDCTPLHYVVSGIYQDQGGWCEPGCWRLRYGVHLLALEKEGSAKEQWPMPDFCLG